MALRLSIEFARPTHVYEREHTIIELNWAERCGGPLSVPPARARRVGHWVVPADSPTPIPKLGDEVFVVRARVVQTNMHAFCSPGKGLDRAVLVEESRPSIWRRHILTVLDVDIDHVDTPRHAIHVKEFSQARWLVYGCVPRLRIAWTSAP